MRRLIESQPMLFWGGIFVLSWCAVVWLVSRLSGWHLLASYYGLRGTFDGKRWRMQSVGMRHHQNYASIVTVGANQSGLYLAVLPPFGFGHRPLFIPWEMIRVTRRRWFFANYDCLLFSGAEGVYVILPPSLLTKIEHEVGKRWAGGVEPPADA